jgi:hypothetical protein
MALAQTITSSIHDNKLHEFKELNTIEGASFWPRTLNGRLHYQGLFSYLCNVMQSFPLKGEEENVEQDVEDLEEEERMRRGRRSGVVVVGGGGGGGGGGRRRSCRGTSLMCKAHWEPLGSSA